MKATYGRVSRAGVVPLSWSMDHIGPMTRTVEDNALALEVLAGFDPEDPASADEPVPSYTAGLEGGVRGMKIGIVRRWHEEDMPAAPEMRAAIDEALRVLEGEGAEIVEVDPGPLQDYSRVNRIILWAEAWSIHEQWLKEKPEAYGRLGRERLIAGAYLSAGDYLRALRERSRCTRRMSEALAGVGRAHLRVEHGARLRHRGRAGSAANLLPPGPPALQRHRPSGARRAGRLFPCRHAAFVPDRRQELRRGHDLPRRPRL